MLPPFAAPSGTLADIASDLGRGRSCLVECDKPLTASLLADLRDRLGSSPLAWEVVDGRPVARKGDREDQGVITTMLVQLRKRVRATSIRTAVALPYLDILASADAGLTVESREVVPLLYENPEIVWLAFRDPSLRLLPVVEKRFEAWYAIPATPAVSS
jgi:cell division protease FtsH